jgi:hypothetical protein
MEGGKMFSTINRYQARKESLDNLIKLSDEEREELDEAEEAIVKGSKRERFSLVRDVLLDFNNINKVFKFCANSQIFKDFCLKNEFSHIEIWAKLLRLQEYPGEEVVSLDRKDKLSTFDQYLGAYFFSEYLLFRRDKKKIDPAVAELYLDMACDSGLFKALVARCENNRIKVKSSTTKNAAQTDALAQIKMDAMRLGNLYWTVGYLHAALVLLDIGNYFANQQSPKTIVMAHSFQKSAARKFLQARELSSYKALAQDEKIQKDICGEKGLLVFEFTGWDDAQTFFLNHVNAEYTSHYYLIHQAKTAMRKHLNVSRNSIRKPEKTLSISK